MNKVMLIALAGLTLAGCASPCREYVMPNPPSTQMLSDDLRTHSGNPIKITSLSTHYVGDLLQGIINMHNDKTTTQNVSYEVRWFDKSGVQLNKSPNILIAELDARADKQVTIVAPSAQADSVKVKLCMIK